MTPAARATALLLAVVAFAVAFAVCAAVTYHLAAGEPAPRPRHVKHGRHQAEPDREWLAWTVSLLVRAYRYEDGGPRTAVTLASLFLVFSVLIGVSQ